MRAFSWAFQMAENTIGTARVDITADSSSMQAAIETAKKRLSSMSSEAQAQYQRLSAAEKRRIDSLIRQADTVGMTRAQQIAYNASLKSSGPLLDDLTRRLKANEIAAKKAGIEFNEYGLSPKMELAALRQMPAQLTDIFVSLQGGQRPLTVLLQQGGQIRDVFGGVTPALKATAGALLNLINPATLSTGALAALAYGYYQGSKEADEFHKTLALTNGAIGVSAQGLQDLASRLDDFADITQSKASATLNLFAKDAKVSAANLQDFTRIALEWEIATGQAAEEVVKQFSELAKDPLKASESLNESMGHLTAETYEAVRALVEAGKETEAANVAQKAYAEAIKDRTPKILESLGYIEQAWRTIKSLGAEALDGILDIGRPVTEIEKLARMKRDFAKNFGDEDDQSAFRGAWGRGARERALQEIAQQEELVRMEAAALRQRQDVERERQRQLELARSRASFLEGGRTKAQKHQEDIDAENRMWEKVSEGLESGSAKYERLYAAHQERLRQIDEKYRDKKRHKKRDILYDDLDDLIASPRVQKNLADYERQLSSVANLINDRLSTAQQRYARELDAMGHGDWARRVNAELQSIADRYDSIIEQRRTSSQGLSALDEQALRDAMRREKDLAIQHYADLQAAQGDWTLGASRALENYADKARDIAGQAEQAFTGLYDGLTDAASKWAVGMDVSIEDVGQSFAAMIIKMQMQAAAAPIFGAIQSAVAGWFAPTPPAGVTPGVDWTFSGASGGYTGDGGRFEPAGIVHKGEGVLSQPEIRAIGGPAGFEALRRAIRGPGHAMGGMAANPKPAPGGFGRQTVLNQNITINTPDANSFRKSQGQISRELGLAANRAIARA